MSIVAKGRWRNALIAASSDKYISEEEKKYLERFRIKLGLSSEEAQDIAKEVTQSKTKLFFKGNKEEKIFLLKDIINVSLADGKLDSAESRLIDKIAVHLEIGDEELKEIFNECSSAFGIKENQLSNIQQNIDTVIHPKTGIEMVAIPEGIFTFGSGSVGVLEKDARVKSFYIAKDPLSFAMWFEFEKATNYDKRIDFGSRFTKPELPVVGVSFDDAMAYCQWADCRLPTEKEWEYAARGKDGRRFPWGNNFPNSDVCNYSKNMFANDMPATSSSGSYPKGVSPMGCNDMAGNVAEWSIAEHQDNDGRALTKGGHWLSAIYALNCYYHNLCERDIRNNHTGFRIVVGSI